MKDNTIELRFKMTWNSKYKFYIAGRLPGVPNEARREFETDLDETEIRALVTTG